MGMHRFTLKIWGRCSRIKPSCEQEDECSYIIKSMFSVYTRLKSYWVVIILVLLILPAVWDLLQPGFFPMHDDLQVFRLYQVDKCVQDLQLPCRWVPDAGFGYGYPLMQFYPPMPYYPMELLKLLGLGFFWPVKIMFALAFIVSGLGMYLLAKKFFGERGGLLSALVYVYSPYHSVDIYVRGALNEAWGMVWFPFVMLYLYKLIKEKENNKNLVLLSIFLALQLTSHNVMTLVFAPTAIIWAIYWIIESKSYLKIKDLVLSGLLGIGLSAFFFLPAVLEQKFVHVDSMIVGYFNYLAHFADLKQLFLSRLWGYGGSTWGPEDGMSFAIGRAQWVLALVAGILAIFNYKKSKTNSQIVWGFIVFGLGYAFLTHSRSSFIWDRLPILHFAQFPWRLVALAVFYFSFCAGYILNLNIFSRLQKNLLLVSLSVIVIFSNLAFFRVDKHLRVNIAEKLSGSQWENQVTGGIFDYLPRSAPKPPGAPAFTIPIYQSGLGGILDYQAGSNWHRFTAKVSTPQAVVMLPLYSYPGLDIFVDGKKVKLTYEPELGRVLVSLTYGEHLVYAKVGPTKIRLLSDLLSLFSIITVIVIIKKSHGRK